MKTSTCCCHICKTSTTHHLYKREFLPCTQCNKIVCKNCFGTKYREGNWEKSLRLKSSWVCPSCLGICPCPRCKKKQKLSSGHNSDDNSSNSSFNENDQLDDMDESYHIINPSSLASLGRCSPKMMACQSNNEVGDELSNRIKYEGGDYSSEEKSEDYDSNRLRTKAKHNIILNLEDLAYRERRCESHIKDMENLLNIMKRERDVIFSERKDLETQLQDVEISLGSSY